jgi:lipopolysaccharide heptosyltransferase II
MMLRRLKSSLMAWLRILDSFGCLALGESVFRLLGMRRGTPAAELAQMQRLLVLRLDQIGDVVMTAPLLRELRRNAPHARITLVVKPEMLALMSICPYVDEVLAFDWHIPSRFLGFPRRRRALLFCLTQLWRQRFDLAIIPRWDVDWYCQTFLAYFSGSRRRIGYSEDVNPIKQVHNRGYDRLLTQALHQNAPVHEVERSLDILRVLGGTVSQTNLEVWTTSADDNWAQSRLGDTNMKEDVREDQPLIAFGPFAGNSVLKQWPSDNFAALGRRLINMFGGRIVILGSAGDQDSAQQLCEAIGPGTVNLAGQCSLPQTVALLKHCTLYIGNDSGPMHLASAAGIPIVALFGPSCPHRFAPWTARKRVLWKELPCSPCAVRDHADCCTVCIFAQPLCIQSIAVEEVVEEVQAAIASAGFLS